MLNPYLTEREIDVLERLCTMDSSQKIADDMGIAYSTLKTHMINIYQKLHLHSERQVVVYAYENGIKKCQKN